MITNTVYAHWLGACSHMARAVAHALAHCCMGAEICVSQALFSYQGQGVEIDEEPRPQLVTASSGHAG